MLTAADLLLLSQWLSPAFPVGGFAYSHGLEAAVQAGEVRDAADLDAWLRDVLRHGAGRTDAILIACAQKGGDLADLDALARAFCASATRRLETERQGHAFVEVVNAVWTLDLPPVTLPVALGAAARARGLPLEPVLLVALHAFAAQLVGAAARMSVLGQVAAQRLLAGLAPDLETIAAAAREAEVDDLGSAVPRADIAAMRHETLYSKVFRS